MFVMDSDDYDSDLGAWDYSLHVGSTDGRYAMVVPLMTVSDVAALLAVSACTVRRMERDGQLPCIRFRGLLRFDADDVLAAVKGEPTADDSNHDEAGAQETP
jgi:excisionase family DNA binding protein